MAVCINRFIINFTDGAAAVPEHINGLSAR